MAGMFGKVLFTQWTSKGFGRELNWYGRLLNRPLTRSTTRPSQAEGVAAVGASDLASRIDIKFVRVAEAGSNFVYQGRPATVDKTFELSETVLTIGQALALRNALQREGRDNELLSLFRVEDYSFDEVVAKSRGKAAKDVASAEVDNCPLVLVNKLEAQGLAVLLGAELPSEMQWERAASGTNGLQRPWDTDPAETTLDQSKAVYADSGTRPVRLKPATNGIFGLIGNVWEWTKETILRGGSWYNGSPDFLRADYRFGSCGPKYRSGDVGVHLARTVS